MFECAFCGVGKPSSEFYGRDKHCKPCRRLKVAAYRERNALKIQAYDLMRLDDPKRIQKRRAQAAAMPKEATRDYKAQYRARHPEKIAARSLVATALKRGSLNRPTQCERCAAQGAVEAHHEDYSRPLDVLWVCHPCHLFIHKQEKRARVLTAMQQVAA